MTETAVIKPEDTNELGQFVGKTAMTFTRETASQAGINSAISKNEAKIAAIEQAFIGGADISFETAYKHKAMALVNIITRESEIKVINGKEHLVLGSKDNNKIRAFQVLSEEMAKYLPAFTPLHLHEHNHFTGQPALAQSLIDARCPDCQVVREYGVLHECAVVGVE